MDPSAPQPRASRRPAARPGEFARRIAEVTAERPGLVAPGAVDDAAVALADAERRVEAQRESLADALAGAARMRALAGDWRRRLRVAEIARSAGAVRLAVTEAERARAAGAARDIAVERARAHEAVEALAAAREEAAQAALAADRAATGRRALEAQLSTARTALAAAEARTRTVEIARATLAAELANERRARAALAIEAGRARAAEAELRRERDAARAARGIVERERDAARARFAELMRERDDARARFATLAADLDPARAALARATAERDEARARVAALAADLDAARAALSRVPAERGEARGLGAALTEERDRRAEPPPPSANGVAEVGRALATVERGEIRVHRGPPHVERPAPEGTNGAAPPSPNGLVASDIAERLREQAAVAAAAPRPDAPVAASLATKLDAAQAALQRTRDTAELAPHAWLRGALVRLARHDPLAAGRILAGLLPAQGAVLAATLDYDLTIEGVGTFAVSIASGSAHVAPVRAPRGWRHAAFHLRGRPLALAELLAGGEPRIRRFRGPLRLRGRRARLQALEPLRRAPLSLAQAARHGAHIPPELVFAALPHAIDPKWTRGHAFTVALRALESARPPSTWRLVIADGAPPRLTPGDGPAEASVGFARATVDALLKGEPAPKGARPVVRGDREAVAVLTAWVEKARG